MIVEIISKLYEEKIEYNEFKLKLRNLLLESMDSIIVGNTNINLECVILDNVNNNKLVDSYFYYKLILSEKIVKDLYDGNKLAWMPIFYELERMQQRYLIFNCKCDIDIIKIIKEMIMRSLDDELKCMDMNIDNSYYSKIVANRRAFYNLILLYRQLGQKMSQLQLTNLKEKLNVSVVTLCDENEIHFIDEANQAFGIDELFEEFIYFNPKWLDLFPQLQIEYFVDGKGHGIKSNYLELMNLYKELSDEDEKKYILYLISKNKKRKILN